MMNHTGIGLLLGVLVSGCYGSYGVTATPAGTTQVTSGAVQVDDTNVPDAEVEASPQVIYDGQPTYLYRDRWYYRENGRWQYHKNEPNELLEHRRRFQVKRQNHEHDGDRDQDRHFEHR
jgi:hypothetical protein